MQAPLDTERLLLRPFTAADVDNLYHLHNDPEVMRFLNGGTHTPREVIERDTIPRFLCYGFWAASEKSTGAFLGWFAFHPTDGGDPRDVELGYRLHKAAWGKGYATEGARSLISRGFTEWGVRRVWAQTMAVNTRSRRVMEKAGLAYVRTFHEEFDDPLPGTEHGEVEYALIKADWEQQQTASSHPRTQSRPTVHPSSMRPECAPHPPTWRDGDRVCCQLVWKPRSKGTQRSHDMRQSTMKTSTAAVETSGRGRTTSGYRKLAAEGSFRDECLPLNDLPQA